MRIVKNIIIFSAFIFYSQLALGLPGEGVESIEKVDGLSIAEVKEAAVLRRQMAEAVCEGKRHEIVDEQLSNLLEVGLYHYCDKYTDEERFCACVAESTYENKLSEEDLKKFEENLIEESRKNIALNSFKVLKEYQEEKNRELANMPSSNHWNKFRGSYSRETCDDSKKLYNTVAKSCSEDELLMLKSAFVKALGDCDDCEGMDITSMPKASDSRRSRTAGEDFLFFPVYWQQNQLYDQSLKDKFKVEEINNKFGSENGSRFKSIGDFQYKELVEDISKRLKDKWHNQDISLIATPEFKEKQAVKDQAFVDSLNNFFLLKGVQDFPGAALYEPYKSDKKKDAARYIKYFSDNFPNKILNRKKIDLEDISGLVELFLETKQNEKLNLKCERLVKTLEDSCSRIGNTKGKLSFELNRESGELIRENKYSDEKFKFDQLYCVAKDKGASRVYESMTRFLNFNNPDIYGRLIKGSSPFASTNLKSLNEGFLSKTHFGIGIPIATSEALATGREINVNQVDQSITSPTIGSSYLGLSSIQSITNPNQSPVEFGTASFLDTKRKSWSGTYSPSFSPTLTPSYSESSFGSDYIQRIMRDNTRTMKDIEKGKEEIEAQNVSSSSDIAKAEIKIELPTVPPSKDVEVSLSEADVNSVVSIEKQSEETVTQDERSRNLDDRGGEIFTTSKNEQNIGPDSESDVSASRENDTDLERNPSANHKFSEANRNFMMGNSRFSQFNNQPQERELSKEELMEMRIKDLENKLQESQRSQKVSKSDEGITKSVGPAQNSFSKESSNSSKDELELNKLKVELEKMKLELAKSELDLEKKEKEQKKITVSPAKPTNVNSGSNKNPLESALSSSVFSPKSKRSNDAVPVSKRGPSRPSSSTAASESSRAPASSGSNGVQNNSSSHVENTSSKSAPVASSTTSSGSSSALLTATSIGDGQLINSVNSSVVSYQNFSDISSAGQSELEKLYTEYGGEVVTQTGVEIILEKDETTGEIRVMEKDKTLALDIDRALRKRRPAAVAPKELKQSSRKRFSLDEFNEIIDNGVKK